jgi:hypothetical protein
MNKHKGALSPNDEEDKESEESKENVLRILERARKDVQKKATTKELFDRRGASRWVNEFVGRLIARAAFRKAMLEGRLREARTLGVLGTTKPPNRRNQAADLEEVLCTAGKAIRQAFKDHNFAKAMLSAWMFDKVGASRRPIGTDEAGHLQAEFHGIVDGIRALERAASKIAEDHRLTRGGQRDSGKMTELEHLRMMEAFRRFTGGIPSLGQDGLFPEFVVACYDAAGLEPPARKTVATRTQAAYRENPSLFT